MKDLFEVNIKDQEKSYYKKFVTKRLSVTTEEVFDNKLEQSNQLYKKTFGKLKTIYNLIYFGFIIDIFFLIAYVPTLFKDNVEIINYIILATIAFIGVILFFILKKLTKKNKEYEDKEEVQQFIKEAEKLSNEAKTELDIPFVHDDIDVLSIGIIEKKNGKIKKKGNLGAHMMISIKIYMESSNLNLCDLHEVISIPLDSIKNINKIDKKIIFMGWNKIEGYNSEKYKPYKIKKNQYEMYFLKPYYQIIFSSDNEDYTISIPSYELDVVMKYLKDKINANVI